MSYSFADLTGQTTTTTGTGTLTLSGSITGLSPFSNLSDGITTVIRILTSDGSWEICDSVLGDGGTTLTRGTLRRSSTGSRITLPTGTHEVRMVPPAFLFDGLEGNIQEQLDAPHIDVQVFASSGTWTKPAGATDGSVWEAIIIGGGGGGGSGSRFVLGSHRFGGSGGAGGAKILVRGVCRGLGSTESVVVGSGGAGGAAVTTDSANGNNGTDGGSSSFGGFLAFGGAGGRGGTGSSSSDGGAGVANSCGGPVQFSVSSVGGTASTGTQGASQHNVPTGGGCGGYLNTFNNPATYPAAGGYLYIGSTSNRQCEGGSAGAVAAPPTNGGNGNSAKDGVTGTGGGGGGFTTGAANVGGDGGDGGLYGGGGGGGGPSSNGYVSGAGGNGASGFVVVVTYL